MSMPPRPRACFAALCLLFGSTQSTLAQDAPQAPDTLLNPLSALDPAKLDGFLGRPLFSSTRRPPLPPSEPTDAPAVEAGQEPPDVRLVGIVRTPKENIAQLLEGGGAHRFSVRVGDFLGDWTVASIGNSAVTLKLGAREAHLNIFGNAVPDAADRPKFDEAQEMTAPPRPRRSVWTEKDIQGFFGQ